MTVSAACCLWCAGFDDDDPDQLCREHLAEYECTTVEDLDRMEREQAYDLL